MGLAAPLPSIEQAVTDFAGAPPMRALHARIEKLNFSADVKVLLTDFAKITVMVGGKLIAFGRKVLDFVFHLVARFQNIGFGVIIALVLSAVLASIPLLGPVVSTLLTPILLAFGIARGAIQDFRDAAVQTEIDALSQKMSIMSAHMTA